MTARVHYADLWGEREIHDEDEQGERVLTGGKYHWLWQHDLSTTEWTTLEPQSPFYLFVPQDTDLREEYEQGWKMTDAMEINSVGTTTGRDQLCVSFDEDEALKKLQEFMSDLSEDALAGSYGLSNKSGWNIEKARKAIRKDGISESNLLPYFYRPFDERIIYFDENIVGRTRTDVMRYMFSGENLGLCTNRQVNGDFRHIICTRKVINDCAVSLATRERTYLFPLYFYEEVRKRGLFDDAMTDAPGGRRPNLAPEFVAEFAGRLKMEFVADGRGDLARTFGPEDVFAYMYAVFHSPAYRSRYGEFLKIDFPRLPLTFDAELFRRLCTTGARLVALHLLEEDAPQPAAFPVAGTNTVEAVRYTAPGEGGHAEGRVWINAEQYFSGVVPEVWNFHVGGYQVCQKWLKDRKGHTLSFDDLAHYRRTVAALAETIRLMASIDETIEAHGGWPLR